MCVLIETLIKIIQSSFFVIDIFSFLKNYYLLRLSVKNNFMSKMDKNTLEYILKFMCQWHRNIPDSSKISSEKWHFGNYCFNKSIHRLENDLSKTSYRTLFSMKYLIQICLPFPIFRLSRDLHQLTFTSCHESHLFYSLPNFSHYLIVFYFYFIFF